MTSPTRATAALLAALSALTLAGCSSGNGSGPGPSTPPSGQDATAPPAITRSLDASGYAGERVCELLTDEQALKLGVRQEATSEARADNEYHCDRRNFDTPREPSFTYELYLSWNKLVDIYRGKIGFFEQRTPLTIGGQPAVRGEPVGGEPFTMCFAAVALSDKQSIEISATQEGKSCELAVAVAERIVRNLEG